MELPLPYREPAPPDVLESLNTIRGWANEALNTENDDRALTAFLHLLQIATCATEQLDRVTFSDVVLKERRDAFQQIASRVELWPIGFNETEPLTRFKALRIGYDLLDSRDPLRRSGRHPFKWFACEIVSRMQFIREEHRAASGELEPEEERVHRVNSQHRRHFIAAFSQAAPDSETGYRVRIHSFTPSNVEAVAALPDFCYEARKQWSGEGKFFFKQLFRLAERVRPLAEIAKQPNNPASRSRIRADVIIRIGRAIESLAGKS